MWYQDAGTGQQDNQDSNLEQWASDGEQPPSQEEARQEGQNEGTQDMLPDQDAQQETTSKQDQWLHQGDMAAEPQLTPDQVELTMHQQDVETPQSSPDEHQEGEVVPVPFDRLGSESV